MDINENVHPYNKVNSSVIYFTPWSCSKVCTTSVANYCNGKNLNSYQYEEKMDM